MFSWTTFWQAVAPSLFMALMVGLGGIFLRLQAYGDRILQLEKQAAENKGTVAVLVDNINALRQSMAAMDVKLTYVAKGTDELLASQHRNLPSRTTGIER